MNINKILDEATRDITKVGVCPAPKSKVRSIVSDVVRRVLIEMSPVVKDEEDLQVKINRLFKELDK